MAITVDAVSSVNGTSTVTSLSWSHTLASDADCLYVEISLDGVGGSYTYNASCTANGVSMTRVHEGATNQYLAVFRLLAPATGTITVQASWTGNAFPAGAGLSLKGVQQTTPEGAVSSSHSGSGSSYSHTIAGASGDLVLTFASVNNNTSATATGSATAQVQSSAGAAYTLAAIASAAGGASITVGHSWASANRYSGASFNVACIPPLTSTITAVTLSLTASATAEWEATPEPDTGARGGDDARREDVARLSRRERRLRRQDDERAAQLRAALERAHRAATVGDEPALADALTDATEVATTAQRAEIAAIPAHDGLAERLHAVSVMLNAIQRRRDVVSRDDDDLAFLLSVF